MDVALPEYELRCRRALRLARALPLLALLTVGAAVGLGALGAALPVAAIGAALGALVAAHAVVLVPGWPRAAAPVTPVASPSAPTGDQLTRA
ncbi:hypothetical protein [Deinococcus rufus]|uniref:Uncharacterized protein n=1 Tax=Deinococcus rufus TaxID=2136097 RepID=A0ABV7ZBY5_9DEIO|nr:hypothetical protein [uncultured Deinococcus sp.]